MPNQLETLKTFSSETEAHVARAKLAAAGITATVHRFSRYRSLTSGGYLLKVRPSDFIKAQAIFVKLDREIDMDEYVDKDDDSYTRCPKCNSVNVEAAPLPTLLWALSLLVLGIPLLFFKRNWTCRKCHHKWLG